MSNATRKGSFVPASIILKWKDLWKNMGTPFSFFIHGGQTISRTLLSGSYVDQAALVSAVNSICSLLSGN
jgi:hypothetical protein